MFKKKEEKGFINYEIVEKVMVDVGNVFKHYELDINERKFCIDQILLRIRKEEQKTQASDLIGNMPFGSIFKKAKKEIKKADGEEEVE